MFALMFALARMASAAWVGAAALFVAVAVSQTLHLSKEPESMAIAQDRPGGELDPELQLKPSQRKSVVAQLAVLRFPIYYWTGGTLLGISLFSSAFLRRRYLKASRWALIMLFLTGACGLMAYDVVCVYMPLHQMAWTIANDPPDHDLPPSFATLHEHSKDVNAAGLVLTFLASFLLCLPGTRPEPSVVMMKEQ